MSYVATIGPMGFRLAHTVTARLPRFEPLATLVAGGETVLSVEEDGHLFLVIDHRSGCSAAARVEFWVPAGASEESIEGLFVLCDALRPTAPVQQPAGLVSLARFLTTCVA